MAALVTLNGLPVTEATVSMPRAGVWHAQVALADPTAFSGTRATLQFGPRLALTGAVRRSAAPEGAALLLLIGGAANLSRLSRPQAYLQAPLRLPLNDLLQVAEEDLAQSSEPEVLNQHLSHWVVGATPVGISIAALMAQTDAIWRMLPDGTFWVGIEAWPDAPDFKHLVLRERPLDDALVLQTEEPAVLPGQSFRGRHVSYVEHLMQEDELRTTVYLEAA